jgi:hypothetical protein
MHINWKTDRSLPTAADHVLGTETIPPNEEGPIQGIHMQTLSVRYLCYRTKMTRKPFGKKATVTSKDYLDRVTYNISVYLNCPSQEGYKNYMMVYTDEAFQQFWSY